MRRVVLALGIVVLLAVAAAPTAQGTAIGGDSIDGNAFGLDTVPSRQPASNGTTGTERTPAIAVVSPNPTADGDAGEYVVVRFPTPTNTSGWTLVDDAGQVTTLPSETLSGRTLFTPEPTALSGNHTGTIRDVGGRLRLANGGDSLALRRPDGTVVSEVAYDSAPEGERFRRTGSGWGWHQPGTTAFDPTATTPDRATAFVLPDAPGVVTDELRDADRRILLAGYTLTSERVVDALLRAHRQDIDVRVLLDGSPVGGIERRQVEALDRLTEAGVAVQVLAGERDPFSFHHAKYAVIDGRALVLTENFKPAGTGGHSSRGWGVVLHDEAMADAMADLFRADSTGPGAMAWTGHRSSVDPVAGYASTTEYPTHFAPAAVPVERARLLVAPDNARPELVELLRSANDSIRIQQMSIEGVDDPLLQASFAAARNGTEVEISLSSASYAREENSQLVRAIERRADRGDLPVSAELVDPRGRFSKVHAKVAIVDDRHVVLGSLNWNPTAYGENREVVVVLTGAEIAGYYAAVFEADARDAPLWRIPTGIVAAVCVVWIALGVVAVARIRWAVT